MAKLEGVKVLDMVGGEITKVAYDGAEYVKVDSRAQIGDLIKLNDKAMYDVTSGAFYEGVSLDFVNDINVIDDEGDEHAWGIDYYATFRKVSASKPTIGERVDSLEKRVDALEEKPEAPKQPFKVGDYIVGNDASRYNITNDKMTLGIVVKEYTDGYDDIRVELLRHATESEKVGVTFGVQSKYFRKATTEEIADYEDSLKPKLKAGDWVKFAENSDDVTAGKKYEVVVDEDNGELCIIDDGGDKNVAIDHEPYEIVAPPSVFERIGRKEGEFKVGDIVRVGSNTECMPFIGTTQIVRLYTDGLAGGNVHFEGHTDDNDDIQLGKNVELIAPVESRVDVL